MTQSRAPLALSELATIAQAALPPSVPPAQTISGVASLPAATADELAFCANAQHRDALRATGAGAVLVTAELAADCPGAALVCADPYYAMARVLQHLYPSPQIADTRHASAVISDAATLEPPVSVGAHCVIEDGAQIGAQSVIGAQSLIGAGVTLGADCIVHPRVTLLPGTRIGARVEIWPGTVIGADGFGYAHDTSGFVKLRHQGGVVIGDDCEIGANATIDRGMFDDTVIGCGVKIDNLVQVAHNVRIGDHSALAGCAGIAGSAVIGRHCQIGGGAGVQGHVELADGVIITGMSKANQSLAQPGAYSSGTAIQENSAWLRNCARFRNLDAIVRGLKAEEGA